MAQMCSSLCYGSLFSGGATPGRARSNDLAGISTALQLTWLEKRSSTFFEEKSAFDDNGFLIF